jgi:hypothetical protein
VFIRRFRHPLSPSNSAAVSKRCAPAPALAPEKLQDEWETTSGWRGFSETDQLSNDLEAIVRDVEDFYGAWLMHKGVPT